ncbi:MAG: hypothetical protein WC933_01705 [Candidatus Paceibacterota bacterium]|jgi:hypothetical protein
MFSKIFKRKIYFPSWVKLLEYAEAGCRHRMLLAQKGGTQLKDFLQGKLDLILSVKKNGSMNHEEYHDITPFVILGYELKPQKKKHQKK